MTGQRILIWYRNDLRLHDHEPLHQALKQQAQVIPFYCFDPRQFGYGSFGYPKTGSFRAKFIIESVADLKQSLQNLGSDLVIRKGLPEYIIPELVKAFDIDAVYYHREVTSEEITPEKALEEKGVKLRSFWGATLYHIEDLPFTLEQLPELFTNFRKLVDKDLRIRSTYSTLPILPPPGNRSRRSAEFSRFIIRSPEISPLAIIKFPGGETAGRSRLKHYFWDKSHLKSYKETRNGMLGEDYSSKFSAWLSLGCLSPRYIYEQVRKYEKEVIENDSTYWLIFELLWRDYFRFIAAKHGNKIFNYPGLQGLHIDFKEDHDRFEIWQAGETGYPLVDANMKELLGTGFMSNRGRQNVASFLTKNLGISWLMGAEWFESMLIDYDVCSNYGNWLYTAGVGNDARGFRYFNIPKQSRDYDPKGEYLRHWLPQLKFIPGDKIHEPWKLSPAEQKLYGVTIGVDYPRPIVDFFKSVKANEMIYNQALVNQKNLKL
ncbi:MAG: Cryptochrome DASH [Chroococcopsis gigantea SAG 12.99]|nr:Cryptochrome DASH [Chroococcopsis gigantea SAG 12.99]